jgi:hypothetical protein
MRPPASCFLVDRSATEKKNDLNHGWMNDTKHNESAPIQRCDKDSPTYFYDGQSMSQTNGKLFRCKDCPGYLNGACDREAECKIETTFCKTTTNGIKGACKKKFKAYQGPCEPDNDEAIHSKGVCASGLTCTTTEPVGRATVMSLCCKDTNADWFPPAWDSVAYYLPVFSTTPKVEYCVDIPAGEQCATELKSDDGNHTAKVDMCAEGLVCNNDSEICVEKNGATDLPKNALCDDNKNCTSNACARGNYKFAQHGFVCGFSTEVNKAARMLGVQCTGKECTCTVNQYYNQGQDDNFSTEHEKNYPKVCCKSAAFTCGKDTEVCQESVDDGDYCLCDKQCRTDSLCQPGKYRAHEEGTSWDNFDVPAQFMENFGLEGNYPKVCMPKAHTPGAPPFLKSGDHVWSSEACVSNGLTAEPFYSAMGGPNPVQPTYICCDGDAEGDCDKYLIPDGFLCGGYDSKSHGQDRTVDDFTDECAQSGSLCLKYANWLYDDGNYFCCPSSDQKETWIWGEAYCARSQDDVLKSQQTCDVSPRKCENIPSDCERRAAPDTSDVACAAFGIVPLN